MENVNKTLALAFMMISLVAAAKADEGEAQVMLIQNSGWMEPFFADPDSPFISLVRNIVGETERFGGRYVVGSFNQSGQVDGRDNPHVLYDGDGDGAITAVNDLDLPRKKSGAFADADLLEALGMSVNHILKRKPGIIWIITNNKNSPGNDPNFYENTRLFFEKLRAAAPFRRILAYLIPMTVKGRWYQASGLILYGIGYGDGGAKLLQQISQSTPFNDFFDHPPVLLKPLADAPIDFLPQGVVSLESGDVRRNGPYLEIGGLSGDQAHTLTIVGSLRSGYYPYDIQSARLTVDWVPIKGAEHLLGGATAKVMPQAISNLPALGTSERVALRIVIPGIPPRSLFDDQRVVMGALRARLTELKLSLTPEFEQHLGSIAAADQIPELFSDFRSVSSAYTVMPVRIHFTYPAWPLLLVMGGLAALTVLAVGIAFWYRPRLVEANLDGRIMHARLRPMQSVEVTNPVDGSKAVVKRGLVGSAVTVRMLDDEKRTIGQ